MAEISYKSLKEKFEKSKDISIRPVTVGGDGKITVYSFCVDGLVDAHVLDEAVLRPIINNNVLRDANSEQEVFTLLKAGVAYHAFADETDDADELIQSVLSGNCGVFFDGLKKALIFDVRSFDKRSVSEPQDEAVLKGAKDCFVETIRTNTALIRRRIRSPELVVEQQIIGRVQRTDIAIVYIEGLADEQLVKQLKNRISRIDIDNIAAPGFIEEFIIDNGSSIFPQAMYSQRPDRIASNLTDGRVCLIIDGFPTVYILPCQLVALMQSPEEYSQNYFVGSSLRFLRYICILVSLVLPSFYIALSDFNSEIIPLQLAISIQRSKMEVPFTSFVETIGLLIAFEILMEAGVRLSKSIGQTISIVGGLVIGQAAVEAKFVSTTVVIVVAATAICGFTIPSRDLANSFRVCRIGIAVLAAMWGLYGMTVGLLFIAVHLCSLDNYGMAYLMPLVDTGRNNFQDTVFRFKVNRFIFRPEKLASRNRRKQVIK